MCSRKVTLKEDQYVALDLLDMYIGLSESSVILKCFEVHADTEEALNNELHVIIPHTTL